MLYICILGYDIGFINWFYLLYYDDGVWVDYIGLKYFVLV